MTPNPKKKPAPEKKAGGGPRETKKPRQVNTGGRAQHDWDYYRFQYVCGPDSLTMDALSEMTGAPTAGAIRVKAAEQNWTAQRRVYRDKTITKTIELAGSTEAEVAARHAVAARALLTKGLQRLQTLKLDEMDAKDTLAFIKEAASIERAAFGMNATTLHIHGVKDLAQLSNEELDAEASRIGLPGAGTPGD